jgi:pimeloyl-ACP methyl ester carboxylesterase
MTTLVQSTAVVLTLTSAVCAAQDNYFDAGGVRIRYAVQGTGEPIVLVHGFTNTAEIWSANGIAQDLSRDHRVITFDLRGHGKSDKPHDPAKYGREMGLDVVRLLDHLGIQRAHVVGYSLGAHVTSQLLTLRPERFISATLIAGSGRFGWSAELAKEAEQDASEMERECISPSLMNRLSPPGSAAPSSDSVEALSASCLAVQDRFALAAVTRSRPDHVMTRAAAAAVTVPTLAIVGTDDPMKAGLDTLVRIRPSVKLVVIDGATHAGPRGILRRPELIAALHDFLSSRTTQPGTVRVRTRVADSLGVPMSGAEVSVVDGLNAVLARGLTDDRGALTLAIQRSGNDHELVVRRIGYRRSDVFFNDTNPNLSFDVKLRRFVATIDTVRVTAEEDVRRKSYFIDAEAIEQANRPIGDALDVVMKLRPDMVWSRTGKPDRIGQHGSTFGRGSLPSARAAMQQAAKWGNCPPVQDVWVNGARIRLVPLDPLAIGRRSGDAAAISPTIATVLASIKPEHIAEMEYRPCTDHAEDLPARASNAIFVTLKPGVGFAPVTGSYVLAAAEPGVMHADPSLPFRVLGVFDVDTGEPVEDARVVDLATGTFARTTKTGTISLAFIPAGSWRLSIEKAGYDSLTMFVAISPRDSSPVTVVLARRKSP